MSYTRHRLRPPHPCQPKRQILFSQSRIGPGAGSFQSRFRGGMTVLECYGNPLLIYLSYTFFDVTSIFVMIYFQHYFYICNTIFFTMRHILHKKTNNVYYITH